MRRCVSRSNRSKHGAFIVLGVVAGLGGCSSVSLDDSLEVPVTKAAMPSSVKPYPRIENTLNCIRTTGVLRRRTFLVGSFADSTGKINQVAPGSTGNFMPQGGSASYITDALKKAGARVVSSYFGAPAVRVRTHYAINGIFNSLDFGTKFAADARIKGIGPTAQSGWAQLTLSISRDSWIA